MKRRIKDMYKICVYHASYPHGNYTLQYAVGPFIQIPFANISSYFHSNLIFFSGHCLQLSNIKFIFKRPYQEYMQLSWLLINCLKRVLCIYRWDMSCYSLPMSSRTKIHVKLALYKQAWQITNMSNGIEKYIFRLCFICSCYVVRHIWRFPGWYNDVDILLAR